MPDQELNIKDIIDKTKNFDQPYAPAIPEGIYEAEIVSFEEKVSDNGYKMINATIEDLHGRTRRVNWMLEIQWIERTLRNIKALYTHNTPEDEKEVAKEKINKFFDGAKSESDLQNKCVEILKKLVEKGCTGWVRVEFDPNKDSKYPDVDFTAYEPQYRWKVSEDEPTIVNGDLGDDGKITKDDDSLFEN